MQFKNILKIKSATASRRGLMRGRGLIRGRGWMLGRGLLLAVGMLGFAAQRGESADKIAGNLDGKVLVEEYLSLTCPHCATFYRDIYPGLAKGVLRDKRVVFVYRDYPLDRVALQAAQLARCGGEALRGKLIGAMLERQHKWLKEADPTEKLFAIVQLVGIDRARAQACLEDKALERAVLEEQIAGQKLHKISSTPTIVVAGKKLSGALKEESIVRKIEKALSADNL